MQRRDWFRVTGSLAAAAAFGSPTAFAATSKAGSVDYGYATIPFALLKGDGSVATFDDTFGATKSLSEHAFDGIRAVRCTVAGAATADVGIGESNPFIQPPGWNGGVMCAVFLENVGNISAVILYLGTSTYSTAYSRAFSGAALISGWNMLSVPAREFNAAGGSLAATMVRTKLRVVTRSSTAFHIAYFAHYQRARPMVLLVCDDGYDEHYSYLKDQLLLRNIPCAFSIASNSMGKPGFMTQAQVQELHNHKSRLFTIVNHGLGNEALTAVGLERYMANVLANRTTLRSWGCTNGEAYHVYVQGLFSDSLVAALRREGFVSAREVGSSNRTAKTAARQELDSMTMLLPASCNLESTQPLSTVRTFLANAIRDGGTFVIMGHRFDPSSSGTIQWTEADMNQLLDDLVVARSRGDIDLPSWPNWYRGLSRGGRSGKE